jgi:hypothetical protein
MNEPGPIHTLDCEDCLECNRPWLDSAERWRAYIDGDGEILIYCPGCASREFDG